MSDEKKTGTVKIKVYEVRCSGTQHIGPAPLLMVVKKAENKPAPDLPRALCDTCAEEFKRTYRDRRHQVSEEYIKGGHPE